MTRKMSLQTEIWMKAVADMEAEAMRVLPTLPGGRREAESVETYAHRCEDAMYKSIQRLEIARNELQKARSVDKGALS